jgi:uncharacterized surface protein with fasciclin (FAS1) repeats
MIAIPYKFKTWAFLLIASLLVLSACNKEPEQFAEPDKVTATGATLGETIAATAEDSLYYRLIVQGGMLPVINDKATTFTMFVPNNQGMKVFINAISMGAVDLSYPNAVFSGFITANIPPATAAAIVSYNIIGQKITSSQIPSTFPNFQLPTQITLPQPPPANPLVKMTTFPSAKTQLAYVNNIPVTAVDAVVANGVIHHVATVVVPPSTVLAQLIYTDPDLSYFRAAIARADSGQVNLNRIDSLLKYGVTNMTVLAPNNAAFQTLIFGLAFQGYLSTRPMPYNATDTAFAIATGNGAVAAGPDFLSTNYVTSALVRGIIAYHLLASPNPVTAAYEPNIRVFSVDFPAASATPFFVKTLINSEFNHPGILVNATFTGPFVTNLTFTGLGTFPPGGAFYSGTAAKAVTLDKHAVNGVLHIIDRVLLPK